MKDTFKISDNSDQDIPLVVADAIKSEAEKRGICEVYVTRGDTLVSETSFEVYKNEDEYIFSVDKIGNIL